MLPSEAASSSSEKAGGSTTVVIFGAKEGVPAKRGNKRTRELCYKPRRCSLMKSQAESELSHHLTPARIPGIDVTGRQSPKVLPALTRDLGMESADLAQV